MSSASPFDRPRTHRKVQGIAAALLPFENDGRVAVDAFQKHLIATQKAGLQNAVNMDTGYVNFLSDGEQLEVLEWTREALGRDVPFVAGAYIESRSMPSCASGARQFCFRPASSMENPLGKKRRLTSKRAAGMRAFWHSNWDECSRRMGKYSTMTWSGV
jgi:hypothetical protein